MHLPDLSPAGKKYLELWCQLDVLCRNYKSETKEADDLRDRMDGPWYEMTPEDHLKLRDFFWERCYGAVGTP